MTPAVHTTHATPYANELSDRDVSQAFRAGDFPVAVYGLGKMGLPLAAVYAETCGTVTGVDIDPAVAEAVDRGESPVDEPGLDALVGELVADGALSATTDVTAAAREAEIHVAIVPTLVTDTDEPDLSVVEELMTDVAAGLSPGDLVVLESTVPPRTCEDRVLPLLEAESGLSRGEFGLAFCPERTSSGRALEDIRGAYPKIVGGVDAESTRVASAIYDQLTDNRVITVADATTAEAVKVFEGVYRDVNIGLANELGQHARELGIDVTEAIEAANTQPFCEIHDPGAGVGGHCIPYYPHFLIEEFDTESRLMETARQVNEEMPEYTASAAVDGLVDVGLGPANARVLVLGLTYRPGVDELRATPALPIVGHLSTVGADVEAVDPVTDDTEAFERAGATIRDLDDLDDLDGETYDAVVLVTDHPEFETLDVPGLADNTEDAPLVVVDGRQALTALRGEDAVHYRGVGINV
ncbi:nucleotide sugar dehydrogenase [Halorarius litoreus]|uniref:nucleotide sugar dehydrogenase n=1 Tax=Halorarius litoreus TaxID=2962676 RepID=UPI0020CC30E2|nr:nucleotide sugar dehydrogenase [Halorarius litoreus]